MSAADRPAASHRWTASATIADRSADVIDATPAPPGPAPPRANCGGVLIGPAMRLIVPRVPVLPVLCSANSAAALALAGALSTTWKVEVLDCTSARYWGIRSVDVFP